MVVFVCAFHIFFYRHFSLVEAHASMICLVGTLTFLDRTRNKSSHVMGL